MGANDGVSATAGHQWPSLQHPVTIPAGSLPPVLETKDVRSPESFARSGPDHP